MANLQITAKLRSVVKLRNPRHARPATASILVCVWLSLHGHAALLDATGWQTGVPLQTAAGQDEFGSSSAEDNTGNSNQNKPGKESAKPHLASPGRETKSNNDIKTSEVPTAPQKTSDNAEPTLNPEQQVQIDSLIRQLSAPNFSQRESAATELLQIGAPALASLRKQLELSSDKETQIRITELIKLQLDGQIEIQIQDFMAMKPVNFEGWPEIRLILGDDTIATRALFVQILRTHPTLPASMQRNYTNRDRSIALESVIETVQKQRLKKAPTTTDAFALLLPLIYPDFVMPEECGELVISILQSNTATTLRKDIQFSPSFRFLLGQWIKQTSLADREDVLFYGMDWDLPQCQLLAKKTILDEKDASPAVLALCLQALAKFGKLSDVAAISTLLADKRPASRPLTTTRGTITNQVSDLAIAAIACIYGVELEDVGFTGVSQDPRFGFQPREIGFPKDAPEQRKAAEQMIKAILDASPPVVPQPGRPPIGPR
ncbi:hypothetical protein OAG34_00575 [bacterium]|jgi:hypothetical protein|nr:hypothetical protein [bacterium]